MNEEIVYRPDPEGTKKLTWTAKFLIAVLLGTTVGWIAPEMGKRILQSQQDGAFLTVRKNSIEGRLLLNKNYFFEVKRQLEQAEESIRLMMYVFRINTENGGRDPALQLANVLREKASSGVDVKVILSSTKQSSHIRQTNIETARYLSAGGVKTKVELIPDRIHAKFVLIDESRMFISNHNWTWSSLLFNEEAAVYFEGRGIQKEVAARTREVFRRVFAG